MADILPGKSFVSFIFQNNIWWAMPSEEANMRVTCEVTHCKFSTPEMSRGAYPAMVAHLQVGNCDKSPEFQTWSESPGFSYHSHQSQWALSFIAEKALFPIQPFLQ